MYPLGPGTCFLSLYIGPPPLLKPQILALRSAYFRSLFAPDNKSGPSVGAEIKLNTDACYEVIHALIRYCYKPHTFRELSGAQLKQAEALNADLLGVQR